MVASVDTLYRVVTAAINDILTHGYDSSQRVQEWVEKIEQTIEHSLLPIESLDANLRKLLTAVLARATRPAKFFRIHKGVNRYTLAQVEPKLRAELDRRILASADLIKLNREEEIAKTLRRFAGWATSIPAGGTEVSDRRKIRKDVRKGFVGLSFRERRVIIDQGHKLSAAVSNIVATDGGAIAGIFRSHWREIGYDYRPAHKARDGKVYLIRDSWAAREGLIKTAGHQYSDEITQPAEEPFCLLGSTKIQLFDDAEKLFRRWYDGDAVTIVIAGGHSVTATPNHPVLTPDGWAPIGSLKEGDNVIYAGEECADIAELDACDGETRIEDLFNAALRAGFIKKTCHGMRPYFHGDGTDADVDIVSLHRKLPVYRQAAIAQLAAKVFFSFANLLSTGFCSIEQCLQRFFAAAYGGMGTAERIGAMSIWSYSAAGFANAIGDGMARGIESSGQHIGAFSGLVTTPQFGAIETQFFDTASTFPEVYETLGMPEPQRHRRYADGGGDFSKRLPLSAEPRHVVSVDRDHFSGHVYNLQTKSGWYAANRIINHNCRCYYEYLYSPSQLPSEMLTEKGREKLAEVRMKIGAMASERIMS